MTQNPTNEEQTRFSIRAFQGIEAGLGMADPVAAIAAKLEAQHAGHLILVQAGGFLHGYGRTAYALSTLKKYRLMLVGTETDPQIRVGFPISNFKRRLWPMVDEFGIPYVVALGTKDSGRTVYVSDHPNGNARVLEAVSSSVIAEVIADLHQHRKVNTAAAHQLLTNPDSTFQLKAQAQDLDNHLLQDILKMPRDLRTTFGENLRLCSARIVRHVMAYGLEENKRTLLHALSAEVDLLKHFLSQAPRLKSLKFKFSHRAALAIELGKLVGGLLRSMQVQS